MNVSNSNKERLYINHLSKGNYRNLRCPCMSGKKVKSCHGLKHIVTANELNEINRSIESHNKMFLEQMEKDNDTRKS